MEIFLTRPLKTLATSAQIVELSHTPGLKLLQSGLIEDNGNPEEKNLLKIKNIDPHFWLDPDNAKLLVGEIVKKLGMADPDNAKLYIANGAALIITLNRLTTELDTTLAEVKTVPFIVFHDAFQYFVKRFDLNAIGAIILNPERTPGARKISRIREKIATGNIRCIFTEPQFNPAIVKSVTNNTPTRISVLDPLGADIPAGPTAYTTLLRTLASALVSCLKR
jgi:zinc transport system substrate-binding protein